MIDVLNGLDVKGQLNVGNPGYTSSSPDGYMKGAGNNGTAGSRFQITANSSDNTRRLWLGTSHTEAAITITEDKVGIGTTTLIPAATKLHLHDSAPELRIQDGGDKASNASGYVTFYDHDSLMMKIGVDDGGACRISNELSTALILETAGTTAISIASDQHTSFSNHISIPQDNDYLNIGASNDLRLFHNGTDSIITHETAAGDLVLLNSVNDENVVIRTSTGSSTYNSLTVSGAGDVDILGTTKITKNLERTYTTVTHSSNTHTCDLSLNDNFIINANAATNTIALTITDANIGQSGNIVIVNASSGTVAFAALPSYMLTPDSATINFVTTNSAVSLFSYLVITDDDASSRRVLVNYVGNFG